jgi:hypothetical protein
MSSLAAAVTAIEQLGPQGIARFQASLDMSWIEEALIATGTASIRRRKFPAEQAVWLVLGMALFRDRAIDDVVDHLGLTLPGTGALAKSAIPVARRKLGPAPIKHLFQRVAGAWANAEKAGDYRGLTLLGIDGTCMRVQDSDANFEHFGKPTCRDGEGGGYPQLRLAALLNLGTRMVTDMEFGAFETAEIALAEPLIARLPDHSLTLVDRGFYSYKLVHDVTRGGGNRHLLARLRKNIEVEVVETLSDGTQRVRINPNQSLRRAHPEFTASLEGRVITYQHPGGEPSRLFTTLMDEVLYPAAELIRLYHDRWELEIAFDELKTHMLERLESLRSKSPEGVEQELWGVFLLYNLVRREMLLTAQSIKVPPRRISFWESLLLIRNVWITAWTTRAPGTIPRHLLDLRKNLAALVLPERRSDRRYPRHVKIKMSNYTRNRGVRGSSKSLSEPQEGA